MVVRGGAWQGGRGNLIPRVSVLLPNLRRFLLHLFIFYVYTRVRMSNYVVEVADKGGIAGICGPCQCEEEQDSLAVPSEL